MASISRAKVTGRGAAPTGKKHILRFNAGNPDSVYSFVALKDGTKKIETRAATEKYRKVSAGDILVFKCGTKEFERKIKKVSFFGSIAGMLKVYSVKSIMPDRVSKKELEEAYFSYSSYREKIRKCGLVAFEL